MANTDEQNDMGRIKGVPHDETELKRDHSISCTDQAWNGLKKLAQEKGISISKLVEQIGRGEMVLVVQATEDKAE